MNPENAPRWFEPGKEPAWFVEAIRRWGDSTVTTPD
jgi:hypothetical protein